VLCNYDTEAYEFVLDFFAFILKYPHLKNNICLIFLGDHGCGKDTFLTWFGTKIIGHKNYYKTARPDKDLFSDFNSSRKNVVFYHIEEINPASMNENNLEQFKNYLSDNFASVQMKNKDTELVPNYNHFVGSSNKEVPFHIDQGQRRIVAVSASSKYCKNDGYFRDLLVHMEDNAIIKTFYHFLMERNVDTRNWLNPPLTAAMKNWYSLCEPMLQPFIEYFRDGPIDKYKQPGQIGPVSVQSSKLYKEYIQWCNSMVDGEVICDDPLSSITFGVEMHKIRGITSNHTKKGTFYTL
jgi:hypothetical protein